MNVIYLDNSATTALCPEAVSAMQKAMTVYGNPSSLHALGQEAQKLLTTARTQVAASLGLSSVKPGELIFTSCGSEATNLALLGAAHAKKHLHGKRIITTDCEHPSVSRTLDVLAGEGFEIVRIPTRGGVLDMDAFRAALEVPTLLVTMMMVNNETGAHFDVSSAFAEAKKRDPQILTHCDAVQGYLKVPFTPSSIHADMVTVSAHKIHGPKGVGALYVNPALLKARALIPTLNGGGQESGMRSGTENVIGICGFGAAAARGFSSRSADIAGMTALRDRLTESLRGMGLQVNVPAGDCAPHIVNLTLPDVKSQTMLNFLSARGICVSSGSACSSRASAPSQALLAFGLSPREADCSLRVSLSHLNTASDVDALTDALAAGLAALVRIRR